MNKIFLSLILIAGIGVQSDAQQKTRKVNENKYRIELPDYWGHGNAIWKVLTDKLPLICQELADKEICGNNCNPKYTVSMYITEPVVEGYSWYRKPEEINTNTKALIKYIPPGNSYTHNNEIYNNQPGQNKSSVWFINTDFSFQCYLVLKDDSNRVLTKMVLVDTNEVWQKKDQANFQGTQFTTQSPDAYIEANKEKLMPDKFELLAIVDKKILAL